ncbi:hypothetical protein C8F04DRAFT_1408411 [Mycena alexandri]|uniref:choline-phosphate cytidylyltransferase n=1 Tax=Mycena alexandri TaxID=1745969 RepID=A0AAD6RZ55_9AGAR|nr:hypothetical protein C8F04DRAFT_1408411 [Mycena alexandri]
MSLTSPLDHPDGPSSFDPLRPGEIRMFVQKAIEGESWRTYKINPPPPTDRPIRVYADGVYDLFHFGHALQLRQAKLAFTSVYLIAGVHSDEQVREHKAGGVMTHSERLEATRHCRWVDEVVADAPWVINQAFLDKYQIDYVAHDEEMYASSGYDDVYTANLPIHVGQADCATCIHQSTQPSLFWNPSGRQPMCPAVDPATHHLVKSWCWLTAEGKFTVYAYCKEQGKFLPTRRTPGVSTSEILERVILKYRHREFDALLVEIGCPELCAEGTKYVE